LLTFSVTYLPTVIKISWCIKVIASHWWDVFRDAVYIFPITCCHVFVYQIVVVSSLVLQLVLMHFLFCSYFSDFLITSVHVVRRTCITYITVVHISHILRTLLITCCQMYTHTSTLYALSQKLTNMHLQLLISAAFVTGFNAVLILPFHHHRW